MATDRTWLAVHPQLVNASGFARCSTGCPDSPPLGRGADRAALAGGPDRLRIPSAGIAGPLVPAAIPWHTIARTKTACSEFRKSRVRAKSLCSRGICLFPRREIHEIYTVLDRIVYGFLP